MRTKVSVSVLSTQTPDLQRHGDSNALSPNRESRSNNCLQNKRKIHTKNNKPSKTRIPTKKPLKSRHAETNANCMSNTASHSALTIHFNATHLIALMSEASAANVHCTRQGCFATTMNSKQTPSHFITFSIRLHLIWFNR